MSSYVVGIDPGLRGALAVLERRTRTLVIFDMPVFEPTKRAAEVNGVGVAVLLRGGFGPSPDRLTLLDATNVSVIIEHVHAIPVRGISTAASFNFGEGYGIVRGVIAALGLPEYRVRPKAWKKALGLAPGKEGSRQLATHLFPQYAGLFTRVKDHDRAEAALLTVYAEKHLLPPMPLGDAA